MAGLIATGIENVKKANDIESRMEAAGLGAPDIVENGDIKVDVAPQESFNASAPPPPADQQAFITQVAQFVEWQNMAERGEQGMKANDAGAPLDTSGSAMGMSAENIELMEDINKSPEDMHPATVFAYDQVMETPAAFGVEPEANSGLTAMMAGSLDFSAAQP